MCLSILLLKWKCISSFQNKKNLQILFMCFTNMTFITVQVAKINILCFKISSRGVNIKIPCIPVFISITLLNGSVSFFCTQIYVGQNSRIIVTLLQTSSASTLKRSYHALRQISILCYAWLNWRNEIFTDKIGYLIFLTKYATHHVFFILKAT
jgi:hypothetical protein